MSYSLIIIKKIFRLFRRSAAASRTGPFKNSPNHAHTIQGNMTEDEALAHALARSIQELDETHDRNHRRNVQQEPTVPCAEGGGSTNTKDKCSLS